MSKLGTVPTYKDKHRLTSGSQADKAKLLALAETCIAEERLVDAVDFLQYVGQTDRLESLLGTAVAEGDLFLATYTAKALARPLGHPEYDAIGYAALDRGKLVFALEAFKRSENQAMIGTLVDQQQ